MMLTLISLCEGSKGLMDTCKQLTILRKLPTIMDKNVGTVVQLERFLTHAKLYLRAINTPRPYPFPLAHGQC